MELLPPHDDVHVKWPYMASYAPDHPTKYCRIPSEEIASNKQTPSTRLEGRLPSHTVNGSSKYGEIAHPTTLEQLKRMLQKDRGNVQREVYW